MAKVDLKIKAKDTSGNALTNTISYVNPALTNAQLSTLAHNLNGLTTNRYDEGQKITTVNIDGESGGGQQKPTFTIRDSNNNDIENGGTYNYTAGGSGIDFTVTYNGESEIFTAFSPPSGASRIIHGNATLFTYTLPAGTYNISFYVQETENYQAAQISFTGVFA